MQKKSKDETRPPLCVVSDSIYPNLIRLAASRVLCVHMSEFYVSNVNIFHIDLTCDVISDSEVNEIRFRPSNFPGLSNAI